MNKILNFLKPTLAGNLFYLFLTTAILLASSLELIFELVTQDKETAASLTDVISSEFNQLLEALSSFSSTASIVTFIFWAIAGSIIYILVMVAYTAFSEAGYALNVETHFVHPKDYEKGSWIKLLIIRSLLHIAVLIVTVAYTMFFVQFLFPIWNRYFVHFLLDPLTINGVIKLLLSIFGFVLSLHLLTLLLRALFLRSRLFGKDI